MSVSHDERAETAATRPAATPTGRLLGSMVSSAFGAMIALGTPLQLLLTLHLIDIAGDGAEVALGVVTGCGALVALVANPLGGQVSDSTANRFGRRRTWILAGGVIGALFLVGIAFTTQVWQVALVWSLVQMVFNFQLAATSALMADQVPVGRRGTASGLLGLAAALAPLGGIGLVTVIDGAVVRWVVIAAIAAALAFLAILLLRDPRHDRSEGRSGPRPGQLLRSFWIDPRRHPAFGWAWAVRFLLMCAYAAGSYNAFFLISRFGTSADDVSRPVLVISLIGVAALAATSVFSGALSDKVGRQKPFVVAAGVLGATGLVVQAFTHDLVTVYVTALVMGIGTGLYLAVDGAMCVRMLPNPESAGKDFAIFNIANTLPQSLVPFAAPALLGLGGFTALYLTLALLALSGSFAVLRLPEVGREGDPRWAVITRDVGATR